MNYEPIVTFITDFGDDFALAQLEAVLLSTNPKARVITISNNITKFSILEGAFVLANSYLLFPKGTIHVGVVDPGVGTEREAVVIRTHDYIFVGPNNGLFYPSVEGKIQQVHQINEKAVAKNCSNTFHGRDVFTKAAGLLTKGKEIEKFADPIDKSDLVPLEIKRNQVVHIDDFGNVKINTSCQNFKVGNRLKFSIKGSVRLIPFVQTFGEVLPGELLAYEGSHQTLEIGKNLGSAAKKLCVKIGDIIKVESKRVRK